MPCIPLPTVTLPSLPAGLSLSPPPLPVLPTLPQPPCCTIPPVPFSIPQVSLTLPVNPVIMVTLAAALDEVRELALSYLRSIPLPCDRD